jgi:two-component system, NarL family, invasion response regulator UvrY
MACRSACRRSPVIHCFVADDHAIVRRGLARILEAEPDIKVTGEARDAHEVLALICRQACDCLILDISMPGRGGLEILKELKQARPKLPVLILSMHPEDQYAVRALKAGAAGYLNKDSAPEELVKATRTIVSGRRYVSAQVAEELAYRVNRDSVRSPHENLSDREFQVLCMVASGKSVTDIAEDLALSVKTISTYRARILDKMGMRNDAELTHYAIQEKLVA